MWGCTNDAVVPQLLHYTAIRGPGESYRTLLPVVSGFTSLYQGIRALWQHINTGLELNQRLLHFFKPINEMVLGSLAENDPKI